METETTNGGCGPVQPNSRPAPMRRRSEDPCPTKLEEDAMCTLKRLLAALVIGIVGSLALSAQLLAQAWPHPPSRATVPPPPATPIHFSPPLLPDPLPPHS